MKNEIINKMYRKADADLVRARDELYKPEEDVVHYSSCVSARSALYHFLGAGHFDLAGLDSRSHFHTLRHTFVSHPAMSGVSLYFIQKILGHQSIETTAKTYAHLQPDPLLSAVKGLKY